MRKHGSCRFMYHTNNLCDTVAIIFQNRNVLRQKAQYQRVVAGKFLPADSYSGVLAVYMETIQLRSEVLGKYSYRSYVCLRVFYRQTCSMCDVPVNSVAVSNITFLLLDTFALLLNFPTLRYLSSSSTSHARDPTGFCRCCRWQRHCLFCWAPCGYDSVSTNIKNDTDQVRFSCWSRTLGCRWNSCCRIVCALT